MALILHATQIGTKAETILRCPNPTWSVLAAVRGAVYITDHDGELLWITDRRSALHPRAVLIPSLPMCLPECGHVVSCRDHLLQCEDLAVEWKRSALWQAARFVSAHMIGLGDLLNALDAIEQVLFDASDRKLVRASSVWPRADRLLAEAVGSLGRDSARHGVFATLQAVSQIVGLGQGLTPQGDDVLGGYLFMLRALDTACCIDLEIDWETVTTWLSSIGHRTNAISHSLLVDHAHGDGCAPLVALVHSVLEGEGRARLTQLASEVLGIGASSGRALLEGVQSACRVAVGSREADQKRLADELRKSVCRPARREVARVR